MKLSMKICVLLFSLLFSSCGATNNNKDTFEVRFDTCTDVETNYIENQNVSKGSLINEPRLIVPSDPNYDQKVSGWYKEKRYVNKWNFDVDVVNSDMTLYAKWVGMVTINYYLKGADKPIWTVNDAPEGEKLERHDELCDGYEFYGYFQDADCTIPFDLDAPLTEKETSVYLYRGESLFLNAHSIKRRFNMMAAGGSGSSVGTISNVKIDSTGEECVDVNFGYSTSADPYMLITNPQIDISHSQKITIKFKNFGGATTIAFYWVSKYEDGSYASGYRFDTEANSAHFRLNSYECYMNENDPWIVREFDLSSTIRNGVSPWANSITLVRLRIQFGYISVNQGDLSNIVRINSISSTSDSTYKGFNDSEEIKDLLNDDNQTEMDLIAQSQVQNNGVIFPKNNDVVSSGISKFYKKKDGVLLYSAYGDDLRRFEFDVSNQNIDAEDFSFLLFKLKNLSYISSLTFYVTTINPNTGRSMNTVTSIPMSIRMKTFDEITVNLYGSDNMIGKVKSFSIAFNFNGVDNAILIQSISLLESRSFQIPGFNFDDDKAAGFVGSDDVEISYDKEYKCSIFTTKVSHASLTFTPDYSFDLTAYRKIALKYTLLEEGVNSLIVKIKTSDVWNSYKFNELIVSREVEEISLPLTGFGIIQDVEIVFDGIGNISLGSIEFVFNQESAFDLSIAETYSSMLPDWASTISFAEDKRATLYKDSSDGFRYYFGYLYKIGRRDYPNIPLSDKTHIYIVYQNQKDYGEIFMNCFAVNSDKESEYLTGFIESKPIISKHNISLQKNMNENDWATIDIEIPNECQNDKYYLSNLFIGSEGNKDISIYIRGIVVA